MSPAPNNSSAQPPLGAARQELRIVNGSLTAQQRLLSALGLLADSGRPDWDAPPLPHAPAPGFARTVQPEFLDSLSPENPAARCSRRDLRVINRLLGSPSWLEQALRRYRRPGECILELGAGAGELGRTLHAITPGVAGLDLGRRPPAWPQQARWLDTDVMEFDRWADYPIVVGNLFFHHFDGAGLARLGARLGAQVRVVIASDPLRVLRTVALFRLLCPLIRAHPVTRHDGRVSINAGFRGDELAQSLQLDPAEWSWEATETWRGSCRLVAVRRS